MAGSCEAHNLLKKAAQSINNFISRVSYIVYNKCDVYLLNDNGTSARLTKPMSLVLWVCL